MKVKISVVALLLGAFSGGAFALPHYENPDLDEFSGDTKLACEAILCLSSSTRPSECASSLARYFGIKKKFWSDTVRARRNFLNICPSATEPQMPELINSISESAERCTAERLNYDLYEEKGVERCSGPNSDRWCTTDYYFRISPNLPNYCNAFINHEFTDVQLEYKGSKDWTLKSHSSSSWKGDRETKKKPAGQWFDNYTTGE
ncbi:TrbM/KikA/MpfK family conjugal transfer protein [Proteus mirabilis]|uniref:TrbM/KikA/MpfK family conjugal transfer protein n=1 Tax=Proteus mirabilis TaxID=584 RepID=UPI001BAF6856|nr:TrbM/KikA/MpfK family conjugal transfer protein [Proteus mirabilis]MBS3881218.1 conjugal transfer protein [Proteus mirabilis]MCT0093882.1 conjugal transfer protein [Proteus mirabilis]